MKLTRREPTVELMGPKNGNMMARNQIGITTGSLASALFNTLFVSCTPMNFSHTKYKGVQANPNVMNCIYTINTNQLIYVLNLIKPFLPIQYFCLKLNGFLIYSLKRSVIYIYICIITDLMNEHEYDSCVSESSLWEQGESIGMRQKHVPKSPVNCRSWW